MSSPKFRRNDNVYYRELSELETWTSQRIEEAIEPDLPIVDPHQHFFDNDRGRYLLDELLRDTASGHRVVATVFVETGSMYRSDGPNSLKSVGEVEFANGIAAMSASGGYGTTRVAAGIVGYADLRLGDGVEQTLDALAAAGNDRLRGIRQSATWDAGPASWHANPRHLLLDSSFRKGFAHLARRKLAFEAWLFYTQLPELMGLLQAFPETTVVLNHSGGILGIPPHDGKRAEVFEAWSRHMRALAQFPNLFVKVGGLGMIRCGWGYHTRQVPPSSEEMAAAWRPYVETCIDAFGPDRCMMESNFPSDKQSCSYGALWNAFKRITGQYAPAEKHRLYSGTAASVYRIAS